jgi:hypothetical protein
MYTVNVPNRSVECTILDKCIKNDNIIIDILKNAAKGARQYDISYYLLTYGFVFYDDLYKYPHKTFDNYITRVQKKFRDIENLNINAHIYYGQIGSTNEFGYYLYVDP